MSFGFALSFHKWKDDNASMTNSPNAFSIQTVQKVLEKNIVQKSREETRRFAIPYKPCSNWWSNCSDLQWMERVHPSTMSQRSNHARYCAQVEQHCDWGPRRRFQKHELPGPFGTSLSTWLYDMRAYKNFADAIVVLHEATKNPSWKPLTGATRNVRNDTNDVSVLENVLEQYVGQAMMFLFGNSRTEATTLIIMDGTSAVSSFVICSKIPWKKGSRHLRARHCHNVTFSLMEYTVRVLSSSWIEI